MSIRALRLARCFLAKSLAVLLAITFSGSAMGSHLLEYDVVFSAPIQFGTGETFTISGTADASRIPQNAGGGSVGSIVGDVDWTPSTPSLICGIPCAILAFIATTTLVLAPVHDEGVLAWTFSDGMTATRNYQYSFDDARSLVTASGNATMSFGPGYAEEIVAVRDFVLSVASVAPGRGLETGSLTFVKSDGSLLTATMVGNINFEDPNLELASPRVARVAFEVDTTTGNFTETVTIIPEPGSFSLLAGAIATLIGIRWKRKKRTHAT